MSFCPACGNPVADDADTRFCARCGRDLTLPAVPDRAPEQAAAHVVPQAVAHTAPQGPPPYAPPNVPPYVPGAVPVGRSPAVLFLRRVATGRWEWPALIAAVPALCVLAVALVLAAGSGAAVSGDPVGMGTRTRIALALLVQGLGGSLRFTEPYTDFSADGSAYAGLGDSGEPIASQTLHSTTSILPWTVTVLWVVALVIGLRALRRRQAAGGAPSGTSAGAETAVRISLLAAVAALVLALVGQPSLGRVDVGTAPFLAALWTFLLTLATSLLVLCRPALDGWLAPRPGLAAAFRALGTALVALLVTLTFAGVVVFLIAAAHYDSITGWGLTAAALMLLNLGVSGLGLAWGAPFRLEESTYGRGADHASFGLSDLSHVWNGWEVAAVVAGGLACALALGLLAARRSRDRVEMFMSAGMFAALFAVLAAVSGASTSGSPGAGLLSLGGGDRTSLSTSVSQALAFALLWSVGGVAVGPYLWRALGGAPVPGVIPGTYGTYGRRMYGPSGLYEGAGVPPAPVSPPMSTPAYGGPGAVTGAGPGPVPGTGPGAVPPQPAAPPEPTVHDLGIVQPDRLSKRPARQDRRTTGED
jgi:hypothetical protein